MNVVESSSLGLPVGDDGESSFAANSENDDVNVSEATEIEQFFRRSVLAYVLRHDGGVGDTVAECVPAQLNGTE